MTRTKVMVADSGISAPQMMDFWRKVGDGSIDGPTFQSFLKNPRRFLKEAGVTLARAMNILGEQKVIGIGQAATVRGLKEFDPGLPIRYSEATLRECAVQNLQVGTDWRLVFCFGLSLRELREQIGTDPKRQPCCFSNDWWLGNREDAWATSKPEPGYYLVDFNGRFSRTSWNRQEQEIGKLGHEFVRAPEAVITEAITTIFQVRGERLLGDWYHWGPSLDSNGSRVSVGSFDRRGWSVSGYRPDDDDGGHLRVCLLRKFQT